MFVGQVGAEDGRSVLLPALAAQGLLTLPIRLIRNPPNDWGLTLITREIANPCQSACDRSGIFSMIATKALYAFECRCESSTTAKILLRTACPSMGLL